VATFLKSSPALEDPGQLRRDRGVSLAKVNQISCEAAEAQIEYAQEIVEVISIRPGRLLNAFRRLLLYFRGFAWDRPIIHHQETTDGRRQ
jgi:hypothetical protein